MELPRIIVGDTLAFSRQVPNYPASDGWTLNLRLIPMAAGTAIEFSSTASGDEHAVNVPAATTAAWTAGSYSWAAYVENGDGESYTIATGDVRLWPDPRTATAPLDLRTDAQQALASLKAGLAAWTGTAQSYTFGGRSMTYSSRADLVQAIRFWEMEVQREKRAAALAAGLADPRKALVRLGRV